MKREERYLVFKYTDLDDLTASYQNSLGDIINQVEFIRATRGKPTLKCVVIEEDWPEYEPVWKLIEERVDHPNTST